MNYTQLQANTYLRVGLDTNDALITSAVVQEFVNEAVQKYSEDYEWFWLNALRTITTVPGQQYDPVDATWANTRFVSWGASSNWSEGTLKRYDLEDLRAAYPPSYPRGRPEAWALDTSPAITIVLRPVPDAVYTLTDYYQRTEPALVSGSDTPLLPVQFHAALIEYAAFLIFRRTGQDDRAAAALATYQDWVGRMQKFHRRTQRKTPVIRVRPGRFFS